MSTLRARSWPGRRGRDRDRDTGVDRERRGPGAGTRASWGLARIIRTIGSIIAGILVLGILLVVLEANAGNAIVEVVLDAARWLAGPFDNLFTLDERKWTIAVNWGIAAAVYMIVASVIARIIRR